MSDPYDAHYGSDDYAPGDNRPSIYVDGDVIVYRSSALGSCIRELVGLRFGLEPAPWPQKFRRAFAAGHRAEDAILAQVEARGFKVTHKQYEINWMVLPGIVLRGHLDAMAQYLGEKPRVCDAKSTGESGISDALHEKYDWQQSSYCHAMNADEYMLAIGKKNPVTGEYEGAPIEITHHKPGKSVADIKARIAKIEALAKRMGTVADLPACDTENRYPCSLYRYHDDEKPVVVNQSAGVDEILDGLAEMYEDAKQRESAAKDDKDNARKQLIEHLGGQVDKSTSEWAVKFTGGGLRKELDKKALEKFLAAHEKKLDEFYGTVGVSKSINVKRVGVGE